RLAAVDGAVAVAVGLGPRLRVGRARRRTAGDGQEGQDDQRRASHAPSIAGRPGRAQPASGKPRPRHAGSYCRTSYVTSRAVRVEFVMLADAAQVVDGKLYVLGGAWNRYHCHAFPTQAAMAFAVSVLVDWEDSGRRFPV